ncbi:MAG: aldo/keto reductase [Bryobacteraceae bacterium]|nr:aldo/keto reductase [Bryobacteraceae bacterium]
MLKGRATPQGTSRYTSRFPVQSEAGFYRRVQGCWASSLGIGTYLGAPDDATDTAYVMAIKAAVRGGINFIDSAINYRHQRSERSIGAALSDMVRAEEITRDQVMVCTKAGFLVPGAVPHDVLKPSDIAGQMHSMAPAFLSDQIERSRNNLNLETIDVFYLHNPESQLAYVSRETFEHRIRDAFTLLEGLVEQGRIGWYGTATWEGYRATGQLSLSRMVEIATEVAGSGHHFRFVQLPFNMAMPEAFLRRSEVVHGKECTVLQAAQEFGITVVASASLLQARLASHLPEEIVQKIPEASTNAQRAIQFTRSTPGISVALSGMSSVGHLMENLKVSTVPPLSLDRYLSFYRA